MNTFFDTQGDFSFFYPCTLHPRHLCSFWGLDYGLYLHFPFDGIKPTHILIPDFQRNTFIFNNRFRMSTVSLTGSKFKALIVTFLGIATITFTPSYWYWCTTKRPYPIEYGQRIYSRFKTLRGSFHPVTTPLSKLTIDES